ncbi:TraM recognition domain-containing protein [Cribrihabitans pelagius]|uniref:TraM recognition domain-containing protein n=1 Tax=Cribrihabitans pelagius TaxID=1765746 RepID=UPI003B598CEF
MATQDHTVEGAEITPRARTLTFANMGKLAGLTESLTALPGLGVRVWAFVQELSELVRLYGPHTARTVLSQAEVKQFFAVSRLPPLKAQRIPFWEVKPWAGWATPNPVEGKTPLAAPKLRLEYKLKGKSNERV